MRPLVMGLAILLSSSWAAAQEKKDVEANEKKLRLYPLVTGTKWEYEVTQGGMTVASVQEVAKVTPAEKKGDRPIALVVTHINGQTAQEEISADEQGVYRHSFQGMQVEAPVIIIKYPYKPGSKWQQKIKIGDENLEATFEALPPEAVKVKAGAYKGYPVVVTMTTMGTKIVSKAWYADGVGVVRQDVEVGEVKIRMELTKFSNEISAVSGQ